MILEWNPKLMVSCGTLLPNLKSNWSIAKCHHSFHFCVRIAWHSCHRCIYFMVIIIFAVFACTINFFIVRYLPSPFLIIFWWLGKFCDHVIFRSISKAFPRRTFQIPVRWNINRARFILLLSNRLKNFPQYYCYLHKMFTSSKHHVPFHYYYQNMSYCQNLGNQSVLMKCSMIFDQKLFLLFSTLPGG